MILEYFNLLYMQMQCCENLILMFKFIHAFYLCYFQLWVKFQILDQCGVDKIAEFVLKILSLLDF